MAALVSTLPIGDAGQRSGIDLGEGPVSGRPVASWRATIDPDSFTGFGTWSGTSFAAPKVAGAIAASASVWGISAREAADRLVFDWQLFRVPDLGVVVNI